MNGNHREMSPQAMARLEQHCKVLGITVDDYFKEHEYKIAKEEALKQADSSPKP